jgi:hypothetical protein
MRLIELSLRLSKHREHLVGESLGRFQKWPQTGFSSYAASIQPVPAYLGLISCLVIIFVFNSTSMWNPLLTRKQLIHLGLTNYLGVRDLSLSNASIAI